MKFYYKVNTTDTETELNDDLVMSIRYNAKLFTDTFKLGSTVCRQMNIKVDKSVGWTNLPKYFRVERYTNSAHTTKVDFAHFIVDSIDDSNDYYYDINLVDRMVLLNKRYDWPEDKNTIKLIVDDICDRNGIKKPADTNWNSWVYRTMSVTWQEILTERDIISYVAELYGGYAIIGPGNQLYFDLFNKDTNTPSTTYPVYDPDEVENVKIGYKHNITRIVFDNGVRHEEIGNTDGDTLYLDPQNIFFTDSVTGGISSQVASIAAKVRGLIFYNIDISNVDLYSQRLRYQTPGDLYFFRDLDGNLYRTFYQMDWKWVVDRFNGGISLDVNSGEQTETNVIDTETERAVNKVETTIDRQQGIIDLHGQSIDTLGEDVEGLNIHFQVNAPASEVRVTNQNTYEPTSYTSFKGDGMRIYVESEQVAEATAQRFECDKGLGVQDWVIEKGHQNANTLIFYRRA